MPLPGPSRAAGFTLIELSIVLVIIGLIVGGVLVGKDLIRAAEIRATVSQIERYNTAVNVFLNKYNGLPGDLVNPTYFFPSVTNADNSLSGRGNGNGQIESCGLLPFGLDGESAVVWYELNQASLIADAITTSNLGTQAITISPSVLPLAKLGKANFIHIANNSGLHYFTMAGFVGQTTAFGGAFQGITLNLTPSEAFQIDSKLDDGTPMAGTVVSGDASDTTTIALVGGTSHATGALAAGDCYDSTLSIYATNSSATKDTNGCMLRIRANF